MTEKDIEKCKEQAKALGYFTVNGKNNVFYYNKFGNSWTVELTVEPHSFPDTYIVEAALSGTNTRLTKDFVTGHEDILGPIHQWCKSLIAFHKFIEG
jgi:hypothetical protein